MITGFEVEDVTVAPGVDLRVRVGGAGPAVVLLHGHPRTHMTWHAVAPRLAAGGYSVICPDLRGYGHSSKPTPDPDHLTYCDRAMTSDVVELASRLGHDRFALVGHDRGSYVAYRAALDHPERVIALAVLDGVLVRAMLEDYRAGLHVDRRHDEEAREQGRQIECATLVAWSRHDDLGDLYGDPGAVWKPWCRLPVSTAVIDSGHHMAEEAPEQLVDVLLEHLGKHGRSA